MGTKLGSLISPRQIDFNDLKGKRLVIDAFNNLYQYLSSIRQYDGEPLKDPHGNVTSHLSGLFFRTAFLMGNGIKPAFVFDGVAPELKKKERMRRNEVKDKAQKAYDEAADKGDVKAMKKYASQTSRLTKEMLDESKELIFALGLPVVQAPSEGEAQAAYMVSKGDFFGLVSQDADALVFGATKVIRNLTVSQKRKYKQTYITVRPEIVDLSTLLNQNNIDQDQLIVLSILSGTDFNIGGVKGIGPKKALNLVKKYQKDFHTLFSTLDWSFDTAWEDIFKLIKRMPTTDDYDLSWSNPNVELIKKILIERHAFSEQRVETAIKKITKTRSQKGLDEWF